MADKRRVFIVWVNPLFVNSLRFILRHPEIEWAGSAVDDENLPEQIAALKPDTVLVEGVDEDRIQKVTNILAYSQGNMRVIGLNLSNNQITVCNIGQDSLINVDDLINLVLKE
jgi:AmiR/NasT family two-component response regulator